MDLNFIALLFAVISAVSLLWRSVRAGRRALGWALVSGLTLLTAGLAWLLVRNQAGLVAFAVMTVFLVIPSRLSRATARAIEQQRYARARRLSWLVAILHPAAEARALPRIIRAFELAQAGQLAEAEALLQVIARGQSGVALMAAAQRLRLLGRWRELKSLGEHEGLLTLRQQPALFGLYVRALGELGYVDDLAKFLLAQETTLDSTGTKDVVLMYLFAFTGQVELTAQQLSAHNRSYSADMRHLWLAVAHQSAGQPEQARLMYSRLRTSEDAQIRTSAERRFESLARAVPEEPPSPETLAIVQRFARSLAERHRFALNHPANRSKNRITILLMAVNAAVYLYGSFPNLFETPEAFIAEWAFFAPEILEGQWWRSLSYLFVHANLLHLVMNLGGLWVLGPIVERAFGRVRFAIIYLVSGCAGSVTYLALALFAANAEELVGASGCIMGLLGAGVAMMLRAWIKHRAPTARAFFLRLLAVVALQVVFDFAANHASTGGPQIASLAHGVGVLGGFLCALLMKDELNLARASDPAR